MYLTVFEHLGSIFNTKINKYFTFVNFLVRPGLLIKSLKTNYHGVIDGAKTCDIVGLRDCLSCLSRINLILMEDNSVMIEWVLAVSQTASLRTSRRKFAQNLDNLASASQLKQMGEKWIFWISPLIWKIILTNLTRK